MHKVKHAYDRPDWIVYDEEAETVVAYVPDARSALELAALLDAEREELSESTMKEDRRNEWQNNNG